MKISRTTEIVKKKTGEVVLTVSKRSYTGAPGTDLGIELIDLYNLVAFRKEEDRDTVFKARLSGGAMPVLSEMMGQDALDVNSLTPDPETGIAHLIDFFTEFQFEPNFRFVNTLARLASSDKKAKEYISNYFALIDSPYKLEISNKMGSDEFTDILFNLTGKMPKNAINTRFKAYYGSQGTGKTTCAMKETGGRCIVCNSSMLPQDLMEDFDFLDGKALFKKSSLWNAMENGHAIVLDEINLLPFDSLRFLQGVLDGKKSFTYKGQEVSIKDGFKVIGTMNLSVNGMTYGLPEPLVDRAEDIRYFKLSAKDLLGALE